MATIAHSKPSLGGILNKGVLLLWETLTSANANGDAAVLALADVNVTITVDGVFGSATVTMKGSNDGANWHTLKDSAGDDVALTAAGMVSLSDLPLYIKPTTAGGGGTQDLDIYAMVR